MSPPGGRRRRARRRVDPGAEFFPGDAISRQETGGPAPPPRRGHDGRLPHGHAPGGPAERSQPADPEAVAREICLRSLSFAPRTRAQLAGVLRREGVPDDVAERVLSRYSEVGLIDDEAFAHAWVESRHAGRGLARRALAAELRQRGVADETVKAAVEKLAPEREEAAARELVARRLAATRGLDPVRRTRRLVGVLARKGYPGGLAYRVVREALEAEGAGTGGAAAGLPDAFDDPFPG